jgi:hypothetical protein
VVHLYQKSKSKQVWLLLVRQKMRVDSHEVNYLVPVLLVLLEVQVLVQVLVQ